jgi:methionine sulfoxide reductase heme-binding subunit
VRRQGAIAAGSALVALTVDRALGEGGPMFRASMATAYVGLGLLTLTLILGPLNVLRARPNPVSTDRRRDLGIWAGLVAAVHVVVGLQVHAVGEPWLYFLWPFAEWRWWPFRYDIPGVANYTGLGATLILLLLLALSNDRSLGRLGAARWKAWQRLNYVAFGLVIVHGLTYQWIEGRPIPWVWVLGGTLAVAGVLQWLGRARTIARRAGRS